MDSAQQPIIAANSFMLFSLMMAVLGRGCLEMYLFCSPSADNLRYRFDLLWLIKAQ
jgi:hypothetical protein